MSTEHLNSIQSAPLGTKSDYIAKYDKTLLFPISRAIKRTEIGLEREAPFMGYDIWNAYEISWLNWQGKPCIAIGAFYIPANSSNIIESKSFKLYLNSFNNTVFNTKDEVITTLMADIAAAVAAPITIDVVDINDYANRCIRKFDS